MSPAQSSFAQDRDVANPIKVSVQAESRHIDSWLALARRLESSGFEALLVGDHPGSGASPWPALGAAAAVTSTLKLGTYVLQAGVRDPIQVAADAATLDVLAPGLVLLGVGAGHTFSEWEVTGVPRPTPPDRAGRLEEFVDAVVALLRGKTVTMHGRYINLVDARLDDLPTDGRVQLVVGGGHPRVLRAGAARAQVVALSGLGRTRPDGHRHDVRWSAADLRAQLDLIRQASADRDSTLEIEALVQILKGTEHRSRGLVEVSQRLELDGVAVDDLDSTPFLLVGTVEEMAGQLQRQAAELGITRYVVREDAVDLAAQILELLDN